jgi:nucleotide-binding universal stress UspA family protein
VTIFVPFDGSEHAVAALGRGGAVGAATDRTVTTVTVVPAGRSYARERGWIDAGEPLDRGPVERRVRERVEEAAPGGADVTVRFEHVSSRPTSSLVARKLRDVAREVDPSLVVIGAPDAGRSRSTRSVGGGFASRTTYDLYMVRDAAGEGPFG